jgi:N-acyl-L-homoserine lactone synthetase
MMAAGDQDRREGRGRLSSIDLLPEEAEPDVVWALEALRERKMPQTAIMAEFNARLADRGIAGVSKSSWSRYAVRKAIQFRRLDEVQRMSGELVASLGTDGPDQVTVTVAEMLKLAVFNLLEGDKADSKSVMELARALQAAVGAQKTSADHRRKLEEKVQSKMEEAADKAETLAREAGISADRIAQLRRDFLGVRG